MYDKKIEQRLKAFQNPCHNYLNDKIETQLSLRKKKLFERFMKKRQDNTTKKLLTIDIEALKIPINIKIEYNTVKESDKIAYLEKIICESSKDTCQSMMNAMWNQATFFLYPSSTHQTCDLFKWAIHHLYIFTKEFSEKAQYNGKQKGNNDEEEDIIISQELFIALLSEGYESNDLSIKNATIETLLNYSEVSNVLNKYFINEIRYIHLLYKLTYINNAEIVHSIILLIHNILYDNPKSIISVINDTPIHIRIIELFNSNDSFIMTSLFKSDLLLFILLITKHFERDCLHEVFESFIFIISLLFTKNEIKNETLYESCLSLLIHLSMNNNLCMLIISTGLGGILMNQLNNKHLIWTYVYKILLIFGNLLNDNNITNHLLSTGILKVFQVILNSYINSCKSEENIILIKLVFAISNITGGTEHQIHEVFLSPLPDMIRRMCKIKSDMNIDYEVLILYRNALRRCNDKTVFLILSSDVICLFCEEMCKTGLAKLIIICLKCIQEAIDRVNRIYHTYENIRNELMKYGGKKKIEELSFHSNQEISIHASALLDMLENKEQEDLDMI